MATKPVKTLKQLGATTPTKDKNAIYKLLTDYILDPTEPKLKRLVHDKELAENLKYRCFNYFLTKPKLVIYLDKYLNNIYFWNKCSVEDWFRTFAKITQLIGISNTNQLYFSRYKTFEIKDFYNVIRKYYDSMEEFEPSQNELNCFYELYKTGIIPQSYIDELKLIIEGKETKVNQKPTASPQIIQTTPHPIQEEYTGFDTTKRDFNSLSQPIQQFCNQLKQYINSKLTCRECPLYAKGTVVLDTNLEEPGPVDIAFIATNPGNEEVPKGIPLIGPAGQIFRPYFDKLISHFGLKYLITNIMLCSTPNQNVIKGTQQIVNRCKDVTNIIHQYFPAKFTVLLGTEAMKAYGIKGGISKLNGQIIDNKYFIMYHPSAPQYGQVKKSVFDTAFAELFQYLKNNKFGSTGESQLNTVSAQQRIDSSNFISKIDDDLTLLDIKIIENKVLYIFKDKNGNKKYHMDDSVEIPIYIKSGQYQDCHTISTEIDAISYLSIQQKEMLSRKLYNNMKSFIAFG